jgi:hypothetical protein
VRVFWVKTGSGGLDLARSVELVVYVENQDNAGRSLAEHEGVDPDFGPFRVVRRGESGSRLWLLVALGIQLFHLRVTSGVTYGGWQVS